MTFVISVIGHEGVGKDTVADMLQKMIPNSSRYINATTLKQITAKLLHVESIEELDVLKNEEAKFALYRGKRYFMPNMHGSKSVRDWLIYVSEDMIKPFLGQDVWAKAFTVWLSQNPDIDVVIKSDDRYPAEFDSNPISTLYVYVDRQGIQGKDTPYLKRIEYMKDKILNQRYGCYLANNGSLEELKKNVQTHIVDTLKLNILNSKEIS